MFSNCNRTQYWNQLSSIEYDVLIVGGGITGAGIALDAVTRGMKVAIVEMQDFAAGTSSRSTKLIHGGLRYLKQFEVKVVSEVGRERAIVYENGPHITSPEWLLLPIYKEGTLGKYSTSFGLRLYDFLANVKKSERKRMLTKEEVLQKEPLLKKEGLVGGGYYVEYRTDDARLTLEVIKKAVEHGAHAINYAKVTSFIFSRGKVEGAVVTDVLHNQTYAISAKKVVNAAGPWINEVRKQDQAECREKLSLTKGVHLVFDESRFPLHQSIYFDADDGRMIFAIPRDGKTYVGTTDTFYEGKVEEPMTEREDINYLLRNIQQMFPTIILTKQDIESHWAGVRPLIHQVGKKPSEISRKDEIWVSSTGLVTVAGGKLTGYRKMAERVVNMVARQFKDEQYKLVDKCLTKQLPISGGDVKGSNHWEAFLLEKVQKGIRSGLKKEEAVKLCRLYGSNIDLVYALIEQEKEALTTYQMTKEVLGKITYAIQYEMVVSPVDFFMRRTGALLFDIDWVLRWKKSIMSYMSDIFRWSEREHSRYERSLEEAIANARLECEPFQYQEKPHHK